MDGLSKGMNPDLVFGDVTAVGDVKYKLFASGEWPRSDLNQIVAFAAAARTKQGIVIGFQTPDTRSLPTLRVGDTQVSYIGWRADEDVTPSNAADELAEQLSRRLVGVLAPDARPAAEWDRGRNSILRCYHRGGGCSSGRKPAACVHQFPDPVPRSIPGEPIPDRLGQRFRLIPRGRCPFRSYVIKSHQPPLASASRHTLHKPVPLLVEGESRRDLGSLDPRIAEKPCDER